MRASGTNEESGIQKPHELGAGSGMDALLRELRDAAHGQAAQPDATQRGPAE